MPLRKPLVLLGFLASLSVVALYSSFNISVGDVEVLATLNSTSPSHHSSVTTEDTRKDVIKSITELPAKPANRSAIARKKRSSTVYLQAELAGGLNNQRICLANAITLGYLLDLVLLKPKGLGAFSEVSGSKQLEQKSVDLNDYFDLSLVDLSSDTNGLVNILPSLPSGTKKVKAHFKGGGSNPPDVIISQISDLIDSKKANYLKLKCQFSVDWRSSPEEIQNLASDVMTRIRPAKHVVNAGQEVVGKLPTDFIVLHVRAEPDWVVLRASAFEKIIQNFQKEAVTRNEITAAFESAKSLLSPPYKNTTIYIAGGTPCDDSLMYSIASKLSLLSNIFCGTRKKTGPGIELTRLSKGKTNTLQMHRGDMSYIKGYVDQLIAEKSSVFIGRKESSWAAMVAYVRRMKLGISQPSTLYLPDYEKEVKRKDGSSDLDTKCFNFKCVPEETSVSLRNTRFAANIMTEAVEPPGGRTFDDVFTCLREASLAVWPGILDHSHCQYRQFLSWFDTRTVPFPIHVTVRNMNKDATDWVQSWTPPFTHSQLNVTSFVHSVLPPPTGIWIYIGFLEPLEKLSVLPTEAFIECRSCDVGVLRNQGVYAHIVPPRD